LDAFVEDKEYVIQRFREGYFDYLDVSCKVVEAEFFRHFLDGGHFEKLASTYPTPRQKEEVPLWVYLCAEMTLRLHGACGFEALPYLLHCGGLTEALGPRQVEVRQDPRNGQQRLRFEGYNDKNHYERSSPCDPDFVRKLSRDTDPKALEAWFGSAPNVLYRDLGAFDPDGIFLVDGTYLFVPDNERYEGSTVLCFDEHNHPISKEEKEKLTPAQQKRCRFRRCYRAVSLVHTDRRLRYTFYNGVRLLPGRESETPWVMPLVEDFIASVGEGVIRWLIHDRGFIDGKATTELKKHNIDSLFPLKKGMLDLEDAKVLAAIDGRPWERWVPPLPSPPSEPATRPEAVRARERKRQETVRRKKAEAQKDAAPLPTLQSVDFKLIRDMRLWNSCSVPISVLLMRENASDGTTTEWSLATTDTQLDGIQLRDMYKLRTQHEEGYRQVKCFWDLTAFRSTRLSLVSSQVTFVLLAYSLMQLFLLRTERGDYTRQTRERLLERLLPEGTKVTIYCDNRVAFLRPLEHQSLVLNLEEGPRRGILGKTRELLRKYVQPPELPLRPAEG